MKACLSSGIMVSCQWKLLWCQVAVFCVLSSDAAFAGSAAHLRADTALHADQTSENENSQGKSSSHFARAQMMLIESTTKFKQKLHEYLHPLSGAAVVTTIALQLSPLPSTLEIRGAGSVKRYDGYPYFSVIAGATQWCLYGSFAAIMLNNMTLFTMVAANGPGVILGLFYVSTYLRFVPPGDARSAALKRYLMFGCGLLVSELIGCALFGVSAVFWLGLLGAIGSAQIALSPFKTLPEVLNTRSTRSWPLDLCMWNLIQSAATGGFGLANNDAWVWMANAVGVIAAVIQLSLIAAYWEGSAGTTGALKL